jgi:hypothetical protein
VPHEFECAHLGVVSSAKPTRVERSTFLADSGELLALLKLLWERERGAAGDAAGGAGSCAANKAFKLESSDADAGRLLPRAP